MGFLESISGGGGGGGSISGPFGLPSAGAFAANVWQNQQNSWQADHAMDRSSAEADREMNFQRQMSNTAYQRATEDMKKAGINPMVAFQQGGASTPGGAQGQGIKAEMGNLMQGVLSSAVDLKRLQNETARTGSEIALNGASATNALAQAGAAGSSAKLTDLNSKSIASQLTAIKKEADARAVKAGWDTSLGNYDAIAGRAARDSGTAKNVMDMFKLKPGDNDPSNWKSNSKGFFNPKTGEIVSP